MQRYFVKKEQVNTPNIYLAGDDAKHIHRVMRMEIGDKIICVVSGESVFLCELSAVSNDSVTALITDVLEEKKELPVDITIAQGLPKGEKLDLIVQKGTELGAAQFIPLVTERTVVKWDRRKREKKIERLDKIAKEAAEQSQRQMIPSIQSPCTVNELVERHSRYETKLVAYEEVAKANDHHFLHEQLQNATVGSSIIVAIGPEGGFSEKEAKLLLESGYTPVSLGPRILRTETASLYFLSAVSYHFELMR